MVDDKLKDFFKSLPQEEYDALEGPDKDKIREALKQYPICRLNGGRHVCARCGSVWLRTGVAAMTNQHWREGYTSPEADQAVRDGAVVERWHGPDSSGQLVPGVYRHRILDPRPTAPPRLDATDETDQIEQKAQKALVVALRAENSAQTWALHEAWKRAAHRRFMAAGWKRLAKGGRHKPDCPSR